MKSFSDSAVILALIDREMKVLKLDFDVKLNALYAGYLKIVEGEILKARKHHRPMDIATYETIKSHLEREKPKHLERIENLTSEPRSTLEYLYADPASAEELKEVILPFCDETTEKLWNIIGEADQKIKQHLAERDFPILSTNIIDLEVKIAIPNELDVEVFQAVFDANVGGAKNSYDLVQTEGMKVAAAIMRKEEARVKSELKILNDRIAPRVQKAKMLSIVTLLFYKFQTAIEECDKRMNTAILDNLNQPTLGEYEFKVTDKIAGILNGLRTHIQKVKSIMETSGQRVVKLATVLNYQLELVQH